MGGFNLPDDVTDAMIDERFGYPEVCEDCGCDDPSQCRKDPAECEADAIASEADRRCDKMRDAL